MTKAPKPADSRAKALQAMNKGELIKTIKALDRKQTTLLNRIAMLEGRINETSSVLHTPLSHADLLPEANDYLAGRLPPDRPKRNLVDDVRAVMGDTQNSSEPAPAFPWQLPNAFEETK